MKFWQKIFILTLILFLIVCNGCIFLVVETVYRYNLEQERSVTVREYEDISSDLRSNMLMLMERDSLDENTLNSFMENYGVKYAIRDSALAVSYEGRLYSGGIELPEIPEDMAEPGVCKTYFRELGGDLYSYSLGMLGEPFEKCEFYYMRKLTGINMQWKELDGKVMFVSLSSSVFLMLLLLFLTRMLLLPIARLSRAVKKIGEGNCEERLAIKGKDEVAVLSENINIMAKEIENRIRISEEESKGKQQFIDNMSHEMRTPLAAVYGYAELIKNSEMSEEERTEALEEIMRESRRVLDLREKLMALTLLRSEINEKEMVSLSRIVIDILSQLKFQLEDNDILFKEEIRTENVYANRVLLEILLVNLVKNSINACIPVLEEENNCHEQKTIVLEAFEENDKCIIIISDNGRGMNQEELKHITEPFYRIDKARSRIMGGAGLGLSICSSIAENQNFAISFESEEGKGTNVILQFPNKFIKSR